MKIGVNSEIMVVHPYWHCYIVFSRMLSFLRNLTANFAFSCYCILRFWCICSLSQDVSTLSCGKLCACHLPYPAVIWALNCNSWTCSFFPTAALYPLTSRPFLPLNNSSPSQISFVMSFNFCFLLCLTYFFEQNVLQVPFCCHQCHFICKAWVVLFLVRCISHLWNLWVDEPWGWFHVLTIVHNATMDMAVQYFFFSTIFLIPWDTYLLIELLDLRIILYFSVFQEPLYYSLWWLY